MDESHARKRKGAKPGLRALEACGDGFWELDLKDGSAWYSEWFYQKLHWPAENRRTTLSDLEPLLQPAAWLELMARIRGHLEEGRPLELDLEVTVPESTPQRWHLQGSAAAMARVGRSISPAACAPWPPIEARKALARNSSVCAARSRHCPWRPPSSMTLGTPRGQPSMA